MAFAVEKVIICDTKVADELKAELETDGIKKIDISIVDGFGGKQSSKFEFSVKADYVMMLKKLIASNVNLVKGIICMY